MAAGSNQMGSSADVKRDYVAEVLSFIKLPHYTDDIRLKYGRPAEKLSIVTWEQRHSLHLPDDLKNFYYAFDGMTCHLLSSRDSAAVGVTSNACPSFTINSISSLTRIGNLAVGNNSGMTCSPGQFTSNLSVLDSGEDASSLTKPRFGSDLKAFELSRYRDCKYCLVYHQMHHRQSPTIWYLDRSLEWHYVAPDFSSFFRHRVYSLYISSGEPPIYS